MIWSGEFSTGDLFCKRQTLEARVEFSKSFGEPGDCESSGITRERETSWFHQWHGELLVTDPGGASAGGFVCLEGPIVGDQEGILWLSHLF